MERFSTNFLVQWSTSPRPLPPDEKRYALKVRDDVKERSASVYT